MTETEKILVRDIYAESKPYSIELKKRLRSLAVTGKYNLFLFMHLGDDFIRLNVKEHFEKQYGKPHFIIQPNEVFLMHLFGIPEADYTVFDYKAFLSEICPRKPSDKVILEYMYMKIVENTVVSVPNTYEPFIFWFCNFASCKEYEEKYGIVIDLFSFIKSCAGVITDRKITFDKIRYPSMRGEMAQKLLDMGTSAENTVLFLPEARSDEMLRKEIWSALAREVGKRGYTAIENVVNHENHIEGCENLNLSLDDLASLAIRCRAIFSLRSGLCDIFALRGADLYVFWTRERLEGCGKLFSFEGLYDLKGKQPIEILLERGSPYEILFDGDDIGGAIKENWLPKKINLLKSRLRILYHLYQLKGLRFSMHIAKDRLKRIIQGGVSYSNSAVFSCIIPLPEERRVA